MASVCTTAKFQWVDNDLSHEKHLIPPAPHVMHFFLKKACNAIAGPFLLGVMSCLVSFANLMLLLPFHLLALMATALCALAQA
jgi:hypothetical protein